MSEGELVYEGELVMLVDQLVDEDRDALGVTLRVILVDQEVLDVGVGLEP